MQKKSLPAVVMLMLFLGLASRASDLVLSSGDYRVAILKLGDKFCSIGMIWYKDALLCNTNGFNSSVLAPQPAKFIGAGHKEGGLELVLETEVIADEQKIENPFGIISGKKVIWKKKSRLDKILLDYEVCVEADKITFSAGWEASEDQPVATFYLHQFCFTEKSSAWMAQTMDSKLLSGEFVSDGKFQNTGGHFTRWLASYFPQEKVGFTGLLDEAAATAGHCRIWDRTNYHKLYYQLDLPDVVKAGHHSQTRTFTIKAFSATDEDWQKNAADCAKSLQQDSK